MDAAGSHGVRLVCPGTEQQDVSSIRQVIAVIHVAVTLAGFGYVSAKPTYEENGVEKPIPANRIPAWSAIFAGIAEAPLMAIAIGWAVFRRTKVD